MSGPKTSSYYVDYERQRQLAEQQRRDRERREEERRIAIEAENFRKNKSDISAKISEIKDLIKKIQDIEKKTDQKHEIVEYSRKKIEECISKVDAIGTTQGKNSQAMKSDNVKLQLILNELSHVCEETEEASERVHNEYYEKIDKKIKKSYNLAFGSDDIKKIEEKKALEKQQIELKKVLSSFVPGGLPDGYIKRFKQYKKEAKEITQASKLKDYQSTMIVPFLNEVEEYRKLANEFDPLLVTYLALADVYETDIEDFEKYKTDRKSLTVGLKLIKERIAELEKRDLKERETIYIYDALSEAIGELGYYLCGELDVEKKKSGKTIHHQLYRVSDETFLDVHYDDNGQISMQVGKGDNCDRQPKASEIPGLVADMSNFCGDYACIEAKLKEKGISTEHIDLLPPEEEHAEIINVAEFGVEFKASKEQERTKAIKKTSSKKDVKNRRKRNQQLKTMIMNYN